MLEVTLKAKTATKAYRYEILKTWFHFRADAVLHEGLFSSREFKNNCENDSRPTL